VVRIARRSYGLVAASPFLGYVTKNAAMAGNVFARCHYHLD